MMYSTVIWWLAGWLAGRQGHLLVVDIDMDGWKGVDIYVHDQ